MLIAQFKSVCRLNRLLVLSMGAFVVIGVVQHQQPLAWGGLLTLVGLVCLFANEFLLKMTMRLRQLPLQLLTHMGIVFPIALSLYATGVYVATGQLTVFLLGFFSVLQAQFLKHPKLGRVLLLAYIGVFLAGLLGGLPKPLPQEPLALSLTLLPVVVALYYYGYGVAKLVFSHTSQVEQLQSIAGTDALTGLINRRQFNQRLNGEIARARRQETSLALALFDIDDFKHLNDFYGHQVGDRILKDLGKLICDNVRECDIAARYGGEEFALILPDTMEHEAYDLLERLRSLVAQTVFCLPENPITISVSVGVVQLDLHYQTAFELIERADMALYEAKEQGKNRVIAASGLLPKVLTKDERPSELS